MKDITEAALHCAAIVNLPAWLRMLGSIRAGGLVESGTRAALRCTRQYFAEMTARFPDGVAPRDLPPAEAQILVHAVFCAAVLNAHRLTGPMARHRNCSSTPSNDE